MKYINEDQRIKCHAIIHSASIAASAVGAGLCWLPLSDAPLITAVQVAMTISLGGVFGIELSKSAAKAAVVAAAASTIGRSASQLATFWIPVVNLAVNASTAAGVTECIGWAVVADFAEQAAKKVI